jgi:hypothetical protein
VHTRIHSAGLGGQHAKQKKNRKREVRGRLSAAKPRHPCLQPGQVECEIFSAAPSKDDFFIFYFMA